MAAAICSSTAVHVDARATMNADWLPDEAPVRFVAGCSRCGYIGADVRPDWSPMTNKPGLRLCGSIRR
jgi:hypothetical protein